MQKIKQENVMSHVLISTCLCSSFFLFIEKNEQKRDRNWELETREDTIIVNQYIIGQQVALSLSNNATINDTRASANMGRGTGQIAEQVKVITNSLTLFPTPVDNSDSSSKKNQ